MPFPPFPISAPAPSGTAESPRSERRDSYKGRAQNGGNAAWRIRSSYSGRGQPAFAPFLLRGAFRRAPDSPEILQDSGEFFPRRQQPSILVHNLLCQPQLLDIITINKIHGGRLPYRVLPSLSTRTRCHDEEGGIAAFTAALNTRERMRRFDGVFFTQAQSSPGQSEK